MPVLHCDETQCVARFPAGVCKCFDQQPPMKNGRCSMFWPRKEWKLYSFDIGDKVRVTLLGENEGRIGEVVSKEQLKPGVVKYWVRFMGQHPTIGEVWDYYGDELEPAQESKS